MAVAVAIGKNGVDTLLVASQVALSIVLPFIVFPLLWLTCSKDVMRVVKPATPPSSPVELASIPDASPSSPTSLDRRDAEADVATTREEVVDYSSGKVATTIGWTIWLVVLLANGYAIVTLAMGKGG